MYVLQVFDPMGGQPGWQFANAVWESEVGLCYHLTENTHQYANLQEAKDAAKDVAEVCEVAAGVFDLARGALVFQVTP